MLFFLSSPQKMACMCRSGSSTVTSYSATFWPSRWLYPLLLTHSADLACNMLHESLLNKLILVLMLLKELILDLDLDLILCACLVPLYAHNYKKKNRLRLREHFTKPKQPEHFTNIKTTLLTKQH